MRSRIVLLLLLAIALIGAAFIVWNSSLNASRQVDVFIIAGQSNAVGWGADISQSPKVPPGMVLQYNGHVVDANDPVGNASSSSAWPQFGITYARASGRRIAFVPSAGGGSVLIAIQDPLVRGGDWSPSGALFPAAISHTEHALAALRAAGYTPVLRGVLWAQGETDAQLIEKQRETGAEYDAALRALIERFRTSLHMPDLPFYIFQLGAYPPDRDQSGFAAIRRIQNDIENPAAHIFVVSRDAVTFPALGMIGDSQIHYTQAGYNDQGALGARNVVRAQAGEALHTSSHPDGILDAEPGSSPRTVVFTGIVNAEAHSCDAARFTFSYGDAQQESIRMPAGVCGPYVFRLSHTYQKAGTYEYSLEGIQSGSTSVH